MFKAFKNHGVRLHQLNAPRTARAINVVINVGLKERNPPSVRNPATMGVMIAPILAWKSPKPPAVNTITSMAKPFCHVKLGKIELSPPTEVGSVGFDGKKHPLQENRGCDPKE